MNVHVASNLKHEALNMCKLKNLGPGQARLLGRLGCVGYLLASLFCIHVTLRLVAYIACLF